MSDDRTGTDSCSPLDATQLAEGTSVLIAGPALTGKRRLLFDLVGGSQDRASIFITTKQSATRFRDAFFETRLDPEAWDVRLIDCVTKSYSESSARRRERERKPCLTIRCI